MIEDSEEVEDALVFSGKEESIEAFSQDSFTSKPRETAKSKRNRKVSGKAKKATVVKRPGLPNVHYIVIRKENFNISVCIKTDKKVLPG